MSPNSLQQIWPEWQITGEPIGKGSFGTVFKAVRRNPTFESHAAIKIISVSSDTAEIDSLRSEGISIDSTRAYLQEIVRDYVDEIRVMESLKGSNNIVNIEDYEVKEKTEDAGWDIYIRMELLTPLNQYRGSRQLTEREVIKLGRDICGALKTCEKRGIIHRDIKPENILVNDLGDFKLGDFGIARRMDFLTRSMSKKGTPNFMAPEVARGIPYDHRADLYSLGLVLYCLMNDGLLPFLTRENWLSPSERGKAADMRLRGVPLPPPVNASPAMAEIILRACSWHVEDRFGSAEELDRALDQLQRGAWQTGYGVEGTVKVRRPAQNPGLPGNGSPKVGTEKVRPAAPYGTGRKGKVERIPSEKKSSAPRIIGILLLAAVLASPAFLAGYRYFSSRSDAGTAEYLLDVTMPYRTSDSYEASDEISMGGDTWSNGFTCSGSGADALGNRICFTLDEEYTDLTFTAGIVEDAGNTVTVTVYGDGSRIYEFSMDSGTLPTDHSVDITGCSELMFSVFDGERTAEASGTYGIAEITVE